MKDLKKFILEAVNSNNIDSKKLWFVFELTPDEWIAKIKKENPDVDDWDDYEYDDKDGMFTIGSHKLCTKTELSSTNIGKRNGNAEYGVWLPELAANPNKLIYPSLIGRNQDSISDAQSIMNDYDEIVNYKGKCIVYSCEHDSNYNEMYIGIFDNEAKAKEFIKKNSKGKSYEEAEKYYYNLIKL